MLKSGLLDHAHVYFCLDHAKPVLPARLLFCSCLFYDPCQQYLLEHHFAADTAAILFGAWANCKGDFLCACSIQWR
ncbi:hypothetical protein ILYODFUR_026238 [Ilyodon furcidens]|uniref:Uncharacterized protein n=1 Tax=Ilyodon furcidens TaxID=33524 RepID=A0ABV0V6Y8_9TELE